MKYHFDPTKAARVVRFIETQCSHVKGELAKQPFILEQWQIDDIINPLFGMVDENGIRQYRTAFLMLPRKNGKSNLIAAIGLYLLFGEGEPGAEIVTAAADRGQAAIIHEIQKQMILNSPEMAKRCNVYRNSIVLKKDASFIQALSADADTKHGFNCSAVLFDELHSQPNRELWDVLNTSTGARRQPLVLAITTAGHDKQSICYEVYDYALKVRDGIIDDPTFLPIVYEAPSDADIFDPKIWAMANPGLGVTIKNDYMLTQAQKAKTLTTYENTFRRLHLNQWTSSEEKWLSDDDWMSGVEPLPDLTGRECFAGLDLAATEDITALVLLFPLDDGKFAVLSNFWVTDSAVDKRRGRVGADYSAFVKSGELKATQGNSTDYRVLFNDIKALADRYKIRQIAFDRWNSSTIIPDIVDHGIECLPFGQGFASMSAPIKNLEVVVRSGKLNHGGNGVLRWMASNVQAKRDPSDNIKFDKSKSSDKIDGMVGLAMAMGAYMMSRETPSSDSVYNERGIIIL
jgi:phage terminase large subunit-like protein